MLSFSHFGFSFFFFFCGLAILGYKPRRNASEKKGNEKKMKEKKRKERGETVATTRTERAPPFFFFFCWSYGFLGRFAAAFSLLNFVFPPPLGAIVVVGRGGGVDGVVWRWVGVTPGWLEEGGVV